MHGFLVVLRHSMDGIPLLLTSGEDEALEFAAKVKPEDGDAEANVLGLDATTPQSVCVYLFMHGKLVGCRLVQDFSREDPLVYDGQTAEERDLQGR